MIAPVSTAAVPVAVYVLGGKQPVYRILEVGLGSAASLDQRDASGSVRNEDVAQAIAAAATELMKFVGDLGDEPGSGSHVHDVGMHTAIMAAAVVTSVGPLVAIGCLRWLSARFRAVAQLGSALDWGSRGRGFKSRQPDGVISQDICEGRTHGCGFG